MIVFNLRCDKGHEFEDWFSSGAAFEEQAAGGELACPVCGSRKVEKGIMAPAVASTKGAQAGACPVAEAGGEAPPCAGACGCFPG